MVDKTCTIELDDLSTHPEDGYGYTRKVSFSLLPLEWTAARNIAQKRGCSMREAIRGAILTDALLRDAVYDGQRVFLRDQNGNLREVRL